MEDWKKIREDAGLERSDIVKLTGIHRQTISAFELQKRKSRKLRVFYLRLRGTESDLQEAYIIEHNFIK